MQSIDEIPDLLGTKKRAVLFLRWVVIIVTSYLVLFAPHAKVEGTAIPLFIAAFLATNLLAGAVPERLFEEAWLQGLFFVLDTLWISAGMVLAAEGSADLFLLYFTVLFLAALGENLAMIMGGCLLIVFLYVVVLVQTRPADELLTPSVLLRIPFLFGIATFYGYLVEVAKRERRRAEAALEHEKFRTDFLATLTHDLQSPLSAVAGFAELLGEAPEQAPVRDYRRIFDAIKRGVTECSELVANFLTLARGEARAQSVRRQVVDLNAVAEEVRNRHLAAAADKDVDIALRLAEGLPPISADRAQIRRAVSNLAGNAVKFAPRGGRVEITTAFDVSAATLAVSDDGPGIPEELQGQIFERYSRGEGDAAGTGLGLFIVRLVAEAHGGSVTLDSRAGQGSRFTLRLPLPADIRRPARAPIVVKWVTPRLARNAGPGEDQVTALHAK